MIGETYKQLGPTKYKATNWSSYNEALKRRGYPDLFDPESPIWLAAASNHGFRREPLAIGRIGLGVPDFSTLCRRHKTLNVNLPYLGGTSPPNLLIDSTGIKAENEGEWNARKYGGAKRRIWRKMHLGVDVETMEVRVVEVTPSNVGDTPMLHVMLILSSRRAKPRSCGNRRVPEPSPETMRS